MTQFILGLLILLLVDTLLRIIFKVKVNNTLNCGIFAWLGKSPRAFDRHSLNILGIMNETRGTHSCGVAVDGRIRIGIDDNKVYRDFLANVNYDNPKTIPFVIGHTRRSTVGSHTMANAHPFGFGDAKKIANSHAFVGVHNGTLHNHKELAKLFGVDAEEVKDNGKNSSYTRSKIDSEILLECLYKSGNFKVLSKYNGAAALVWSWVDEPEYTYCYHGESKKNSFAKETTMERPLFYYKKNENSLYVSSLKDSLYAIGGDKDTVGEFDTNTVYKIKNGDVENAEKFLISRSSCQIEKAYRSSATKSNKKKSTTNSSIVNAYTNEGPSNRWDNGGSNESLLLPFRSNSNKSMGNIDVNIHCDQRISGPNGKIYFEKLRYKRNGHSIPDGIYMWVPYAGFKYLTDDLIKETKKGDVITAEEIFMKTYVNKAFCVDENNWIYDSDKILENQEWTVIVPFRHGGGFKDKIKDPAKYFHYFIDGIEIKTASDFSRCLELKKNKKSFSLEALSVCSKHPVVKERSRVPKDYEQGIIKDNVLFTGTICPLGSEKVYVIDKGNCIKQYALLYDENDLIFSTQEKIVEEDDPKENYRTYKKIIEIEEDEYELKETPLQKQERRAKSLENLDEAISDDVAAIEDEKVLKIIDETFPNIIEQLQITRTKIEKNHKNSLAKEANIIINDFVKSASHLLAIEINE